MVFNLPKDILIKIILCIEDEYKNKFLQLDKLSRMIHNVFGFHALEYYTCCSESCKEFCFAYHIYCNDDVRIITSQNTEDCIHLLSMGLGKHSETIFEINKFEKCGFVCEKCCKWACQKHFKDYIQLSNNCYSCNEKFEVAQNTKKCYEYPLEPTSNKFYYKLPKNVLIEMIPNIEEGHKTKYFETKKIFDLLCKLAGERLERSVCSHHKSCNEFCYTYNGIIDDSESGEIHIITSQNSEMNRLSDIAICLELDDDPDDYDSKFDNYGRICCECDKWVCTQHWKDNFDENKHLFC